MPLIDFSTAGLAGTGDISPGSGGMTTSSRTNANVLSAYGEDEINPGPVVAPQMAGTTSGHPVTWWIALGVILVILKFSAEKLGKQGEFQNVRVGFFNIMVITLSAIFGLTLFKWVFGYYTVPGLSAIVEAA